MGAEGANVTLSHRRKGQKSLGHLLVIRSLSARVLYLCLVARVASSVSVAVSVSVRCRGRAFGGPAVGATWHMSTPFLCS